MSTVGARINDVYFNNILDEQISVIRLLDEIELGSKNLHAHLRFVSGLVI